MKDLKREMRASVLGCNQGIEMLEGRIDVLDEDVATFQIQMDSLAEKACHCVNRIVPVQKREPDVVFFNPRLDLLLSEGTNHSSWAPSELEYVTPPLGAIRTIHLITNDEVEDASSPSRPCACSTSRSSDEEGVHPASPLVEVPSVPLDPIDSTLVMRQD